MESLLRLHSNFDDKNTTQTSSKCCCSQVAESNKTDDKLDKSALKKELEAIENPTENEEVAKNDASKSSTKGKAANKKRSRPKPRNEKSPVQAQISDRPKKKKSNSNGENIILVKTLNQ